MNCTKQESAGSSHVMSISSKFRSFYHECNVMDVSCWLKYLNLNRNFKIEDRVSKDRGKG